MALSAPMTPSRPGEEGRASGSVAVVIADDGIAAGQGLPGSAFERAQDDAHDHSAERGEDQRRDEPLHTAEAELPGKPAADDCADDADDDRRQTALGTARPDEPARDRAGQEADDDPADDVHVHWLGCPLSGQVEERL